MASEQGRPHRRGFSVIGPAILIALGAVFLLNSLDIVPWSVWGTLWRFWPVILILLGVQTILGRSGANWAISLAVSIAAVVLLVGVVVAASQAGWIEGIPIDGGAGAQQAKEAQAGSVSNELGTIQEARSTLEFGAGRLSVDSLPSGSDKLVVVDYSVGAVGRVPSTKLTQVGRQGNLDITGSNEVKFGFVSGADEWNVHLNPAVPQDLTVRIGAADGNLDLRGLKVRTLNLDVGASAVMVGLPANAGSTNAFVNSGAAALTLEIPAEVGARIVSDSGLASINASSRFSRAGGVFTTDDYQTAANRLDVELKAGVSTVSIK
ncbi:MAG: DUF5668 domain-containing protein [Dehalococcoidia bacterium]|nr:DUF5668 domain-containing protein [Dehalococcoidia bacterium]